MSAQPSRLQALVAWIDARLPLTPLLKKHVTEYYAPKNCTRPVPDRVHYPV